MKTMTLSSALSSDHTSAEGAANPMKSVFIVVIAAKIAVAGLLMTTVNLASPIPPALEIAELR
ncbi:hypothetical protein SAMN05880582_1011279 [Rhizobium sp. RU20A]|uniref:hypothetical protein n=1 Tax=Rhizobium sp. RU20A TaxID=1907412 RepID=UPI00095442F3|nr:hypothetical protein [Rhizobium sp. RU20A]SIQ26054.1 hypothetical protein SAMN05880582_1011279 [Rhizobium sp. RU20A]